ncbi:LysM peptidoglycan-binding domain-containing protein [Nitratireductor sp. XY-223]|uniref:LysM peptidoglycan-binding domain-containing protein n=1 Tax=Nitratireductor sp. XY-223 TaxID=2561926 RepID=UPI0010AA5BC4|nr:LysM peptidoglycan-binding domain-containing protein [Nitratireductor sp. XY-223]
MNIEIQQPQPFDLVGQEILIAGNAVGFESHLTVTVSEGHDEVVGAATAGSTSIRQFQASIFIPDNVGFTLNRLFVTVADDSAGGEGGIPTVTVPVLYGPMILPGYTGYFQHEVAAGDTLTAIAQHYYEGSSDWQPIMQANQHIIANPDLIFPGQVLRIPRNV